MKTPWSDPDFARRWNETYGMDMRESPIRRQLAFPLLERHIRGFHGKTFADFGCGNGNLIGHFLNEPFVSWTGYDGGSAILDTARNHITDPRVSFRKQDLTAPGLIFERADVVTSVFVIEEIPNTRLHDFFGNVARAVKPGGMALFFTQHPAYAMMEDHKALAAGEENKKFHGHRGYFDMQPSTYALAILNQRNEHPVMVDHHHKTMARIFNVASSAGLCLDTMVETPAGVEHLIDVDRHQPKRGDSPRFLFLKFHLR